jgi:quercetin dioxygenase-like cupin family protein
MEDTVIEQTLHQRGTTLVRRLFLAPGEATRWHRDPFHRLSIVFTGEVLAIEFRDGSPCQHVRVAPGQVDWEEPSELIHRAINVGDKPYEEITVFFLDHPGDVAQPDAS